MFQCVDAFDQKNIPDKGRDKVDGRRAEIDVEIEKDKKESPKNILHMYPPCDKSLLD